MSFERMVKSCGFIGVRGGSRWLLLLVALLLPTVGMFPAQQESAAQEGGTDYLWAGHSTIIGACASPSSAESLANCFSQGVVGPSSHITAMATDGTNVYFASQFNGGLSCPVDEFGQNCTQIMTGPWPSGSNAVVNALVVADGQLWIGQGDGKIYRCPANLPYVDQSNAPQECVLLDDAGNRPVFSLLLANGRLYAGLNHGEFGAEGLLWSCDAQQVNACETLDAYGATAANSLVAGGGYLWAGLDNGILWRCDLNAVNSCKNWDTAGTSILTLSYDGQNTMYAALTGTSGSIWSCPIDVENSCGTVRGPVNATSVAAGAGGVFSSSSHDIAFGTTLYSSLVTPSYGNADLLYIPAEGLPAVGGVDLSVRLDKWSHRIGRHCDAEGEGKKQARVTITGPNGIKKSLTTDLCALRPDGTLEHTFDLLDSGPHTIKVRARGFIGKAKAHVEGNATIAVTLRLKANR